MNLVRCDKCGVLFRAAPGSSCSCGGRRTPEIPQMPQRQDGLDEQLRTVIAAATRLGCYDAVDYLNRLGES